MLLTHGLLSALSLFCLTGAPASQPSDAQILEWLRELKPLPKVHYSWPIHASLLRVNGDPRLIEYVRLTRAASLSGMYVKQGEVEALVYACKAVNEKQEKHPPATLAINYSPWHMRFGKELPPTDTGPTEQAELDLLNERLSTIRTWIKRANERLRSGVEVSAVLLDSERFQAQPGNAGWNTALTRKYNLVYDACSRAFPGARIEWYGRGAVYAAASDDGWSDRGWYPLTEKGHSFSCSLYTVPMLDTMRETFRRTFERARANGIREVTPWVALGSGYKPAVDRMHRWEHNWDYDLVFSWQLGAELNIGWYAQRPRRYAPWDAAKVVVFYPGPWEANTPAWPKHFIAYVRGANGIKKLPEQSGPVTGPAEYVK